MTYMKNSDQRFVNIEKKIGIFIVVAVIGIISAIVFIALQHGAFTSGKEIHFFTDNVKDIKEGQIVTLNGIRIGKVQSLSLHNIKKVKVSLSIKTEYMKWIKSDSVARLIKDMPIGEGVIEIIQGGRQGGDIEENEEIRFEKIQWFSTMTKGIDPFPISIADVPVISGLFKEMKSELDVMLPDLKETLKNLRKLTDLATKTDIKPIMDAAHSNLSGLNGIIRTLADDTPAVFEKLNKSLDGANELILEVKDTLPKITILLDKSIGMADSGGELVGALKQTWPIKKHFKKVEIEEEVIKLDSYE